MNMVNFANNLGKVLIGEHREHQEEIDKLETALRGCDKRRKILMKRNWKHGCSQRGKTERLHTTWVRIRQRCHNTNATDYNRYGGKGISVCDEWRNDFIAFRKWALSNGYSDDLTIERIDFTGNYCPENCTWIPLEAQARNKSNNHLITFNGETKTLAEWGEITGIETSLIRYRLRVGWSTRDALLLKPSNKHKGGNHGNKVR